MRQFVLAAALGLGVISAAAADPLTITATVGGIATGPDLNFLTFSNPAPPSLLTMTLDNAEIVTGSAADLYAAPYFSGDEGNFFGESPANGEDATAYLAVEGGGSATFTFNSPQTYFGLLWGSVDSYNSLSFYDGSGNLIETIGGDDVEASASGDQGSEGTDYVNIFSDVAFTTVIASSTQNAFEIDDVAYDPPPPDVPEPASLAVLGAALAGFWLLRRRAGATRYNARTG